MNPTRSVVGASLLAVMLIVLGGSTGIRKLRNGINATVGRPSEPPSTATGTVLSAEVFTAWAVLFVMFIIMTDFDATAPLGVGLAFLLLLSVAMLVGPDALNNIASLGRAPSSKALREHGPTEFD